MLGLERTCCSSSMTLIFKAALNKWSNYSMNILIYICAAKFACSAWPPTTNSSYSHHSECNFNKNTHPFKSSTKTTKPRGSVLPHRFGYWHNPKAQNNRCLWQWCDGWCHFDSLDQKHIESKKMNQSASLGKKHDILMLASIFMYGSSRVNIRLCTYQ